MEGKARLGGGMLARPRLSQWQCPAFIALTFTVKMFPPFRRLVSAAAWLAAALVLLATACESNRGGPSPVLPGPGVTRPSVVRLEIVGPGSIPPDGSEQFNIIGHGSDGSQRDVTSEAVWNTEDRTIVSVMPSGLARGLKRGETDIQAAFAGISATKHVLVLPQG